MLAIAPDQSTVSPSIEGGTVQWMSPELLYPERFGFEKSCPTKESDCYALGMVVYEVLSGQTPFESVRTPVVIYMVLDGQRPERPQGEGGRLFTDEIWGILELCWEHQPRKRTSAKAVLLCLEGASLPSWPSPGVGGNLEADNGDQSDTTPSASSPFSPFYLGPTFDYPCGILGLLITSGGDELQDLPQIRRDTLGSLEASTRSSTLDAPKQEPPPEPKKSIGGSNLQMSGVSPPCARESPRDTKPTPFVVEYGGEPEQVELSILENPSGGYLDQTYSRPDPSQRRRIGNPFS